MGRYPIAIGVALIALWTILNGLNLASWLVGIPTIVGGLFLTTLLPAQSPFQLRLPAILYLLTYFVCYSLLGAWDVARRALSPDLRLKPGVISYPLSVPPGLPQVLLSDATTLLPGTLTIGIFDGVAQIHTIDLDANVVEEVRALEGKISALFGQRR